MAAAAAAVNCTAADMKLAVFDVATTTAAAPRRPGCYRRCELITFRWTRAQTLSTVGENLGTIDFIPSLLFKRDYYILLFFTQTDTCMNSALL